MPMTSYLTLEGTSQGPIEGDCDQSGREKKILVYALDHRIEIPRDTHTGLATGQRIHHPLTISKRLDPASPLIGRACATGERMSKFDLDFYQIDKEGKEVLYYKISLSDAIVVEVKNYFPLTFLDSSKSYPHMEQVSFTYSKIIWSHETESKQAEDDWKAPAS
ncbi:MAG: Hcp family type VI secretion system effector [Desulfococcaceae bacterium]|jgi:type VI secretion system secreted protein Hcp|nr:Hcp family type VI secretion system effector [Desulfococcaceae bacterium]